MKLGTKRLLQLVDLQARMSLKAEASRLLLSYGWWILEPVLFVIVFYFVFGILLNTGRADFLLFLVCGKIPFMWFSKTVTLASNSISQNKSLITQIDIPKIFFPLASIQQSLYREVPVFLLMLFVALCYGRWPSPVWLLLLPLILVEIILILAASCLGAVLVARVADAKMLISMGMLFLLFVSGIFWDVSRIPNPETRELLLWLNPMAFLLDAYRKVLMHGVAYDLGHLAILGAIGAVVFGFMVWWMRRSGRRIAGWVINA